MKNSDPEKRGDPDGLSPLERLNWEMERQLTAPRPTDSVPFSPPTEEETSIMKAMVIAAQRMAQRRGRIRFSKD